MSKSDPFGEAFEQGISMVKKSGKAAVSDVAKTVASQLGANPSDATATSQKDPAHQLTNSTQPQAPHDAQEAPTENAEEQNKEVVKSLYAKSDASASTNASHSNNPTAQIAEELAQKYTEKSPEEIQKMAALRQQLHKETYYDPTFNAPKPQEERPVEKVEREKQEEQMELQKKEEEKPVAIDRASKSTETFRGAAG